jgi:hypothetical protein
MRLRALAFFIMLLGASAAGAETLNGFDLSNLTVDRAYVMSGGPPKDGIPALTDPEFVAAGEATISDDDRIIGVAIEGEARAYPLAIMNWHEVVNDRFGDRPVVVTYCPLCFTGMAFDARRDGKRQEFGVSGLLYNSDVLLYDRATESLWSQIKGEAVSGPLVGATLEAVPVANTTWGAWRERYPDSRVLSRNTGHRREYDHDPYAFYDQSPDIKFDVAFRSEFDVAFRSQGFHPKQRVLGLTIGDQARAYPITELDKVETPLTERIGDRSVTIHYDAEALAAEARDENGELLPGVLAYWFAWYAFHPETSVFRAEATEN